MARHSPEALRIKRELQQELKNSATECGEPLEFSAVEQALIRQIMAAVSRKSALESDLIDATDAEFRLKLATEIRGIEGHVDRMLRRVDTSPPSPAVSAKQAVTSAKARAAVATRWDKARSAG
jgi:hypothetical protein